MRAKNCIPHSISNSRKGKNKFFQRQGRLPASSFITPVNDTSEQQADEVSDKVINSSETLQQDNLFFKPVAPLQRKAVNGGTYPRKSSFFKQVVNTPGQPLDGITKQFMEQRFGYNFGNVQIHNNEIAHQSSKEINALAYTYGNHIVFAKEQYQPASDKGKRLLAHELTHVVQQERSSVAGIQRQVAPSDSFWFNNPKNQTITTSPGSPGPSAAQLTKKVYVEPALSQVGNIYVRFAYPEINFQTTSPSPVIVKAKNAILQELKQVYSELTATYTGPGAQQKNTDRARLQEIITSFGQSNPLNIYIDTNSIFSAMRGAQLAALTGSVYVDMQSIGNPSKLRAAILIPDIFISGGIGPGGTAIQPASSPEMQRILLHEGVHAMLIQKAVDAETLWSSKISNQLKFNNTPATAVDKVTELIRNYLISQEELFAYDQESLLYPPLSPNAQLYRNFIKYVETFFSKKQINTASMKLSIKVNQQVNRKTPKWDITYEYPKGAINLTASDVQVMDLILTSYPLK